MSLMLRKSCQPLLDKAGLDSYHADIVNERYQDRTLKIVGKCGQRFISITGISFNRKTPTQTEVEYATELLREFLAEHKATIDVYIKEAILLKGMTPPDVLSEDYTLRNNSDSIRYFDNGLEVVIDTEGRVVEIAIRDNMLTATEMLSFKFNAKTYKQMTNVLNDAVIYRTKEELVSDLRSDLSKCSI